MAKKTASAPKPSTEAPEGQEENWFDKEETETQVEAPKTGSKKFTKDKAKAKSTTTADDIGLNDEEPTVAKKTKTIKKATKGKPAKAVTKKAKAPKGEGRAKLAGKTLAPTAKAANLREGTIRHTITNAFKGGEKYDAVVEDLEVKQPRGDAFRKDMKAFVAGKIATMVRKGFLAVK